MFSLLIYALVLALPVIYLFRLRFKSFFFSTANNPPQPQPNDPTDPKPVKNIMQPPRNDLLPPKDDPFTLEQLKEFDGSDPAKPIYVSIKGTVFDVSLKKDIYGPGKSYGIFAGKDGSKALGLSSLKPEDAVPDYSGLQESDMKVLNDWHSFFSKRYNIVGRVIDHPVPNL